MDIGDDGRIRTGTVWTATAHAVTTVIGSGVLAVPWSVAQMGWIYGPLSLFGFAVITCIMACLLCDCYRTPDPVKGQRNHSYMDAVRSTLGKREVFICAVAQYTLLWGTMVGNRLFVCVGLFDSLKSELWLGMLSQQPSASLDYEGPFRSLRHGISALEFDNQVFGFFFFSLFGHIVHGFHRLEFME